MSKCDYCGRENAATAATCAECGTELPRAPGTPPPVPAPTVKNTASRHMMLGGLWFLGGTAVTVGSYVASESGGFILGVYGAILWGLAEFIYGFINRKKSSEQLMNREAEDAAYEALAEGARLETQGKHAAALALYQKIAELHPDTPVGWDALASIKNLHPPPP